VARLQLINARGVTVECFIVLTQKSKHRVNAFENPAEGNDSLDQRDQSASAQDRDQDFQAQAHVGDHNAPGVNADAMIVRPEI